ncbi:M50 family metallopeptidase [Terribacillus sp. DMT04]|uniref:M50 family metallopeptidase n=1 Tax=Terribacillus sp. DMT04 TaxID=2850441 RepID=UPI001C2C8EB8|nr:M50 family metallopeptidase [Terribacillus sp. DMT04]QXE00550.1 M50 family metallopeptidase [Terribacillus sp. DMT04]
MTHHNWLPPIHLHPIFWAFLLAAILTGMLMEVMVLFGIVLLHEMAHFLAARHFRWRIRRVMLWVFGGVMETEEHGNRRIREEVIVVLAGPAVHIVLYAVLFLLNETTAVPEGVLETASMYNTTILLFNLLPIWPLDGGKLVGLILSMQLPYRKAHAVLIGFSCFVGAVILLYVCIALPFTLSTVSLLCFLLWENRLEWKRRYYVFLRFLLQRTTCGPTGVLCTPIFASLDTTLLDILSQYRRNRRHIIVVKGKNAILDEQQCSDMYFKNKQAHCTVADILQKRQ